MVKPTYPGVYIIEEESPVHTITAVATSITVFFGRTAQGPVNKPVRIHTLGDFYKIFGPPIQDSELATGVQLFFNNGGTDAYIVRLIQNGTGSKASILIKNEANTNVLNFTAKEVGIWGNELALEVDYDTPSPEDTFHLRIYRIANDGSTVANEEFLNCSMDPDSPRFAPDLVSQNSELVDCSLTTNTLDQYRNDVNAQQGYSQSRRIFDNAELVNDIKNIFGAGSHTTTFQISVDGRTFAEVNFKGDLDSANNENDIKNAMKTKIDTALQLAAADGITVDFVANSASTKVLQFGVDNPSAAKGVFIKAGSSDDASRVMMLGPDNGGLERPRAGFFRPAPSSISFDLNHLNELAVMTQSSFNKITIDGKDVKLENSHSLVTSAAGDPWYKGAPDSSNNPTFDGVREKISIIASAISSEISDWIAKVSGSRLLLKKRMPIKNYSGSISTAPTDIGNNFEINSRIYSLGVSGPYSDPAGAKFGTEGGPPDKAAYMGDPVAHTGFYALDTVDLFNLMVIPQDGKMSPADYESLWAPASVYCQSRRTFLIVEPPAEWKSKHKVLDQSVGIRTLRRGITKDYSAVYFPRLVMPGPNGLKVKVNPGGAIAGVMARTDATSGVWKAPAGLKADIQGGNFDLDILLTDLENGDLNQEGINCLREFPSGIICWGARTMDGADDFGSQWKYIPIRRLALMIEESLYRGTKWVVFEPNDEPLWAKIRLNVGAFMNQLFRQGAFQGSTPDKAYFVKCDGETTTQADRDQGIVNIIVGFAPLKPAEFVIIKIQQMKGDL